MFCLNTASPSQSHDMTSDGYVNESNLSQTNNCLQIIICLLILQKYLIYRNCQLVKTPKF